jgi:hypothetical protein
MLSLVDLDIVPVTFEAAGGVDAGEHEPDPGVMLPVATGSKSGGQVSANVFSAWESASPTCDHTPRRTSTSTRTRSARRAILESPRTVATSCMSWMAAKVLGMSLVSFVACKKSVLRVPSLVFVGVLFGEFGFEDGVVETEDR